MLDLAVLPTRNLNIVANGTAAVRSTRFRYDNKPSFRLELAVPFSLFGNREGDYHGQTPPLGNHSITATPYAGSSGTGTVGTSKTLRFTMVDSSRPA